MGNKGGYILGTSLAKDKTQIISDLLFMDFVSVAIRVVGEVPNFLYLAIDLSMWFYSWLDRTATAVQV